MGLTFVLFVPSTYLYMHILYQHIHFRVILTFKVLEIAAKHQFDLLSSSDSAISTKLDYPLYYNLYYCRGQTERKTNIQDYVSPQIRLSNPLTSAHIFRMKDGEPYSDPSSTIILHAETKLNPQSNSYSIKETFYNFIRTSTFLKICMWYIFVMLHFVMEICKNNCNSQTAKTEQSKSWLIQYNLVDSNSERNERSCWCLCRLLGHTVVHSIYIRYLIRCGSEILSFRD